MHDPSGRALAHVSHSVSPEKAAELTMNVTCGPLFGGLSPSGDLQRSLGSRLRAKMDGTGSPEYVLTWKLWDMQSGPRICALRASGRRISGKDCGGWPTAASRDWKDSPGMAESGTNPDGTERTRLDQLPRAAQLTGPAPSGGPAETENGGESQLGGWKTPEAQNCSQGSKSRDHPRKRLTLTEQAGWATPRAGKTTDENPESWQKRKDRGDVATMPLTTQAQMAGYPTPRTITGGGESAERKKELGRTCSVGADLQAEAEMFRLPDMTGWKLNPFFSAWLQGYPKAWTEAGLRAMKNFSLSRRKQSSE